MSGFWRDFVRLTLLGAGAVLHDGASCAQADQEVKRLRRVNSRQHADLESVISTLEITLLDADELRARLAEHDATKTVGGPPPRPVPPGVWRSGPSTPPATAPEET